MDNRVLIVDDNPETILHFRLSFDEKERKNIDFSLSGKDALSRLKSSQYDKVITDFRLNDEQFDGLMVLQAAKKAGVAVRILITAVSTEIMLAGTSITNAIRKPCDTDMIREMTLTDKWDNAPKQYVSF